MLGNDLQQPHDKADHTADEAYPDSSSKNLGSSTRPIIECALLHHELNQGIDCPAGAPRVAPMAGDLRRPRWHFTDDADLTLSIDFAMI